jgi:hypothetical protein
LATRSREIFRGKWATELERQPIRSLDRTDCARLRDHRCDETRLVEIPRRMPTAEAAAVIDEAGLWAEAHPTSRMTVRVDRRPEIEGWRRKWCPRGLEIVIDPS